MKQVKFKVKLVGSKDIWEESDFVPDGVDPQTHFENVVKMFNEEEDRRHKDHRKYQATYRELVSVGDSTGKKKVICNFDKLNTMTILRDKQVYDLMKCKNCKLILKRIGLGQGFDYDRECHSELVCTQCNKQFKSEKNLTMHNERGNHKTQIWYPDGI